MWLIGILLLSLITETGEAMPSFDKIVGILINFVLHFPAASFATSRTLPPPNPMTKSGFFSLMKFFIFLTFSSSLFEIKCLRNLIFSFLKINAIASPPSKNVLLSPNNKTFLNFNL